MSGAVAGPSSTTSSPVRTRHSATHAVEPYDSPLREGDSSLASYASGGLDAAADLQTSPSRRGHGDLGDIQTVIYSKRDSKGKGKARETEYAHVADDVRIPVQVDTQTETAADPDADDEEAEERRIQENLAKWSKADAERRAALRRSSRLGSSTVVVPPPPIPGASDLIRRTSTLLRSASQRRRTSGGGAGGGRRGGPVSGGLTEEELELAAAGQVQSPVLRSLDPAGRASADSEDVASRRDRRKMSLKLDSDVDLTSSSQREQEQDPALQSASTARSNFSLPRVGEDTLGEDDDDDALRTPTTENPSRLHAAGNPFSAPSQLFLASTGTAASAKDPQTTPRHTRGGSVFIENLPPLPRSPAAEESRQNPFASPHPSPDKSSSSSSQRGSLMHGSTALRPIRSSSSFASRDPDNPFIDVVVTSPSPAKPSASSFRSGPGSISQQSFASLPSPPHSPTRGARSSPADPYSAASISTMSGSYRPPSPAFSASSNPASPLQGGGGGGSGPRRRRSYDPRTEESADYDGRLRRRDVQREYSHSRGQQQQPEEPQVGWLSWLFCGCLRPENEDGANSRDDVLEQRGRTNPME
ncbi:hypothetical protein JCM8115_004739 [Rhodotorula mucilaginosa]|nr:hypothetical protein B0A53_02854 [Rhodotorula sp. CCFEE 5036]